MVARRHLRKSEEPSHQIDKLRVDLALAVSAQGRHDEALAILRARAAENDASPELLRTVHRLILSASAYREFAAEEKAEALEVLRKAADYRADPQRPMTLYNLLMVIFRPEEESEEAVELLDELLASHSYYRYAWYVKRLRGVVAWHRFQRLSAQGDHEGAKAAASEAAKWYSRAIRARPKLKLFTFERGRWIFFRTYPSSAILHANAYDAHAHAGNRLRAWFT